jgi:hypothetical protein
MRPLFTSYACDYCDGVLEVELPYSGYALWDPGATGERTEYVFPTRTEAKRYRAAVNREHHEVRAVRSEHEFTWRVGGGNGGDIVVADHVYTIFPDHRFEPAPNRACLAPVEPPEEEAEDTKEHAA